MCFSSTRGAFRERQSQNRWREEDIDKIIETYQKRPELMPRYARRVDMDEIEKEGFNLNISRYISTATAEAEIDLAATHQQLLEIENKISGARAKHNKFLKELGLPPSPARDRPSPREPSLAIQPPFSTVSGVWRATETSLTFPINLLTFPSGKPRRFPCRRARPRPEPAEGFFDILQKG